MLKTLSLLKVLALALSGLAAAIGLVFVAADLAFTLLFDTSPHVNALAPHQALGYAAAVAALHYVTMLASSLLSQDSKVKISL